MTNTFQRDQSSPSPVTCKAETPYLVLDLDCVTAKLAALRSAFAPLRPQLFYPVKTNGEPRLLRMIHELDGGFDVASLAEIRRLQELGVPPARMIFSSPVKVPGHIEAAHRAGVDTFTLDSPTEVAKLERFAPAAKVLVRLDVPQQGSRLPLGGKFGVPPLEALELLRLAQVRGLQPYGVAFHVGSQCTRPETWLDAINQCGLVWNAARKLGMQLMMVNLGGGLPSRYTEEVPTVESIGTRVARRALSAFGPGVEYAVEPGRYLVADAGTIVTTVIGKALRKGRPWIYVDLSIYAGLLEVRDGWNYPVTTEQPHLPTRPTTLAGPTCDSTDVLAQDVELPDLDVGDRIRILTAGAYTTCWQEFNGFRFPEVITASGGRLARVEAA